MLHGRALRGGFAREGPQRLRSAHVARRGEILSCGRQFFADERSDEPQTLKSDEVWVSLPFFFENLGTGQLLLIAHHPRRERGHYQ